MTVYRVPMIYDLSKNKKKFSIFYLKIIVFKAMKNSCMLHRRFCAMLDVFVLTEPKSSQHIQRLMDKKKLYILFAHVPL